MTSPRQFSASDWPSIRLVVFDLDGTLYEQRSVRIAMATELAVHSVRHASLRDLKAISRFRVLREAYADRDLADFESECVARASTFFGLSTREIFDLVEFWMESRPLKHLRKARVIAVEEAFATIKASGRTVAVWSDYRVPDKLRALGLAADLMASASDPEVGRFKPDPAGLMWLCANAGVPPAETLMVGDRFERDGEAARRAGAFFLLRGRFKPSGFTACFQDYRDPLFQTEVVRCHVSA